jgi:hypothetical protein
MRRFSTHMIPVWYATPKRGTTVNTTTLDWRAILVVVIILLIVFSGRPETNIVALAIGAVWAIQSGIAPWRGRGGIIGGSTKVTYWRGERYRSVSPVQVLVSFWYIALGLGMAYAALLTFIRLNTVY